MLIRNVYRFDKLEQKRIHDYNKQGADKSPSFYNRVVQINMIVEIQHVPSGMLLIRVLVACTKNAKSKMFYVSAGCKLVWHPEFWKLTEQEAKTIRVILLNLYRK